MIVKRGDIYYAVIKYKNTNDEWRKKWVRVGKSKREAERRERELLMDRDSGVAILDRNTAPTMDAFFDTWLDAAVKPPSRSLGTYENYQFCLSKIRPKIGNVRLDKLTPLHLTKVYKELQREGLSASTVRMVHRVVRAALNKAVRWQYIEKNPALFADVPSKTPSPGKALERDDALALLEWSEGVGNVYSNLIIALGMLCGLRDAEICGLRWQDYDAGTSRLYIRHNLSRRSLADIDQSMYEFVYQQGNKCLVLDKAKTESSCNYIVLPDYVKSVIEKARAVYEGKKKTLRWCFEDNSFILCGNVGEPRDDGYVYRTVQNLIAGYNEQHKDSPIPKIRAHDLRHTAATLLLEENVDIKYVSRQLRHSSTVITQNLYQHVTDRMAALPAQTIDRLLKK